MSEQTGTFYAVSVGPGDPELLTLQAVRVLEHTPVIAAPQTASGQMLALDIARGAVDLTGKSVLPLRFTMSHDAAVRAESYRAAASAVEAELRQGRDVAMVNLGDVALYATAYYIFAEIERDGFPAVMLPGVTSVSAVAARQSPKPRGRNSGASSCPMAASRLSAESATTLRCASKVCRNQTMTVATKITPKARCKKSLALSHISSRTLFQDGNL